MLLFLNFEYFHSLISNWLANMLHNSHYKWIHEISYISTTEKDMKTWLIIAVTHKLSSCEIKPEKNSGLNGIRTHDLCDTGIFLGSSNIWYSIYSLVVFTIYGTSQRDRLPVGLIAQLVEHCTGIVSRSSRIFFSGLVSQLLNLCTTAMINHVFTHLTF